MSSSSSSPGYPVPPGVLQRISEISSTGKKVIVMTCGLAGSGKSTLSRNLTHLSPPFTRLSIDTLIIASRGTYDSSTFTSDTISQYQSEAETTLISQLTTLLKQAEHDIVLDLSFYSNEWRNETRAMIEKEGRGRHEVLLVVFRGEEEFIWRRIESRNVLFESKLEERRELEGVVVSREMLRAWKEGFEWPDGEGEIIVWIG